MNLQLQAHKPCELCQEAFGASPSSALGTVASWEDAKQNPRPAGHSALLDEIRAARWPSLSPCLCPDRPKQIKPLLKPLLKPAVTRALGARVLPQQKNTRSDQHAVFLANRDPCTSHSVSALPSTSRVHPTWTFFGGPLSPLGRGEREFYPKRRSPRSPGRAELPARLRRLRPEEVEGRQPRAARGSRGSRRAKAKPTRRG